MYLECPPFPHHVCDFTASRVSALQKRAWKTSAQRDAVMDIHEDTTTHPPQAHAEPARPASPAWVAGAHGRLSCALPLSLGLCLFLCDHPSLVGCGRGPLRHHAESPRRHAAVRTRRNARDALPARPQCYAARVALGARTPVPRRPVLPVARTQGHHRRGA